MHTRKLSIAALLSAAALCGSPTAMSGGISDSDFNHYIGELSSGRDTGSGWFDHYVATLNQEIAYKEGTQPYGAAGPNGPLDGFNGYIAGFQRPDTGSMWFNNYVDAVNRDIQDKQSQGQ
ncbi:MAG: hypothetical protein KF778_22255 [Rhodocyclaceae bacterium]|nr:hypothetical protein [Rhodocyclaceae bacterium]MBX3671129.1 hypothetical protein [Rhodocyclaceae bacterium]